MPEDKPGMWEALAGIETVVTGQGMPRKRKVCVGLRAAYVQARYLALEVERQEQRRNPMMSAYADRSYPNSVGVYWAVQPHE